jgi:hypothetical protein
LTIRSGIGASIVDAVTVSLPAGLISADVLGRYLRLIGTTLNGGDYLVTSILSATRVKVKASFTIPDPSDGAITWLIYDPRDGEIADDPSHVTVRINSVPTAVEAVIGLLGQIVMPGPILPSDDVKVDYSWVCNPTVDCTRFNSKEFRFNNWNRDQGRPADLTGHKYRYNNVLLKPAEYAPSATIQTGTGTSVTGPGAITLTGANVLPSFVGLTLLLSDGSVHRIEVVLSTTDVQVSPATLVGPYVSWGILDQQGSELAVYEQPLKRELHYRAYERAYTPIFNDPNLLIFNSPNHKIAYPPLQRTTPPKFVSYQPTGLPENDLLSPWLREGTGTATVVFNELVVGDVSGGPPPTGKPIFWRQKIDLTFPHVFALAWRFTLNTVTTAEGIFTGVSVGYSTDLRALVVGFLDDGGVKKFGILKKGYGNDPSTLAAWVSTAAIDWDTLHSYRIFRAQDGTVRVYVDGNVVESLLAHEEDLPYLEELNVPFVEAQQAFWGSISLPAVNQSTWDFVRYQILPINPYQSAPSSFASYEGTTSPEDASSPWTPVGFHGTETIQASNYLLLDSTSATDEATEAIVGLMGGDFRSYMRIEPLLAASSDIILDVNLQVRTHTHGISPNAVMAAIDDGDRLIQLSFFPDKAAPKFSYGGRTFPENATPIPWASLGTSPVTMVGRLLRISDASTTNGRVYYVDDATLVGSDARVVSSSNMYILESRCTVNSYTADVSGFSGVMGSVYDSARTLGFMLQEVAGVRYVTLHSDGSPVFGGAFAFDWFDGEPHTYRLVVAPGSDLVSLFVDGAYIGSVTYSVFTAPPVSPIGVISFGSATPSSLLSRSVVDWYYTNCWRVLTGLRRYVGLWKGTSTGSLIDYHLPLKVRGQGATVAGNVLTDTLGNFVVAGLVAGDRLIIDGGGNQGVYEITAVFATTLVVSVPFPVQPAMVSYRVPKETDWTGYHRYRISQHPSGGVSVLFDSDPAPLIQVGYDQMDLPSRTAGVPMLIAGGMPSIVWGALDPTNLSQTSWDYVRYGITRSPTEMRIAPHHQVLNQRNVMASPEHLSTSIPHPHTDFWSSSTGIPPQTDPDFFRTLALQAFTQLNEGTPLVPSTQTSEVRVPTPIREFVSAFNRPEDVFNSDSDFVMNDGATRWKLLVPDDVLYNSLEVIEQTVGATGHIAPFDDDCQPDFGTFYYQKEVCLTYDGATLPENAPNQPTPWVLAADDLSHVNRSAFAGILTFGTDVTGTRAIYRNATPLPDSPSLTTQIQFRMKVLADSSFGLADSQIRLGFSALNMTLSLAFITSPLGDRYVLLVDQNALTIFGGIRFDWFDGLFHVYRILRDPGHNLLQVFVDS